MTGKEMLMLATRVIPDRLYLQLMYRYHIGKWINFKSPKSFNEKLQWLKLYDRRPEYTMMVDKLLAKEYVANIIGQEHIIPTLAVWDDPSEIDFDSLPDQFVLKCNHDSHSVIICKDKSTLDRKAAIEKLSRRLKKNAFWHGRVSSYKNIKKKVFAEKYMEDESGFELKDYKFFCFNGEPKCLDICSGRFSGGLRMDYFDMDFNKLPFECDGSNSDLQYEAPACFEEMKKLARKLSEGIPFLRVDFYYVNGTVLFSELTFFHGSGFLKFEPEEWDEFFGDYLTLPEKQSS